ncbi:hypothetical protein ASF17_09980 [Frigoribacterium sp. Leaf263]|nr:hypothetical protein ASF17_09980 [Frigoribacterium sp. Leaf263]KQR65813.1 hypothetical protein ASF89_01080 [Frigoribacterium sp. Leaf172]
MALSRKQKKELNKFKKHASAVWTEQREVFGHAGKVLGDARDAGVKVANKEVVPRVRHAVDNNVRPAVSTSLAAGSKYATKAQDRLMHDVYPSVQSYLNGLDITNDPKVKKAVKNAKKQGAKVAKKYAPAKQKSGPGVGGVLLIGVGVVALGALVFAAVQTLRADDELWVADDDADTKA